MNRRLIMAGNIISLIIWLVCFPGGIVYNYFYGPFLWVELCAGITLITLPIVIYKFFRLFKK